MPEDIVTIISDAGEEIEFLIVDAIEYENIRYIFGFMMDDIYSNEIQILGEEKFEDDIEFYEITNEELKEILFKIFEERNFN